MKINLNLSRKLFVPKFFPLLYDYSHRLEFYMGSAGSSKSYFITQKLILKGLKSKRRIFVARRYGNTNRQSTFSLFKEILSKFKLIQHCKIRETDMNIILPNGTEIMFIGLDNEEKLLSLADVSDIFIEEIFEVDKDTFEQLNLRMRGSAENLQILAAFNPISMNHWLYDFCEVNPPSNFLFTRSTYQDNPFLQSDYIAIIEEMKLRNPNKYRIYGLGEWGVDSEGLVYTNWTKQNFNPMELAQKLEHRVGMDLGFIDATTIVQTLYDKPNKTIYIYSDFYKSGAQLDEIAAELDKRNLTKTKIYCDSAEPRTIDYFRKQGFNIVGAKKGKNSVETGIAFLQNHILVIHPSATEVIRELENYTYLKEKHTGKYTNNTNHDYSHTMDGLRYAYSDIYSKSSVKVLDKSVLGL